MRDGKSFLAVIPARGGSKRLPNKNILPLAGKPLIQWTIEAAKNSKYIDQIVVSSDKDEILDIAKRYETISIKRPEALAKDEAKTVGVVLHVIESISEKHDFIVLLQPTSPLRTSQNIDEAIELLFSKNADAVISVCETDYPILWCNTLQEDLSMKNFIPEDIKDKRSQDLPKYYRLNGAIYIVKTEKLKNEKTFFISGNIYAYIMDRINSVDIDEEIDLKVASALLRAE
jgi:N-acylneuraminate cytidylyltransferase/CMP-N,N'-diacetyllegionaminic acid synthase